MAANFSALSDMRRCFLALGCWNAKTLKEYESQCQVKNRVGDYQMILIFVVQYKNQANLF